MVNGCRPRNRRLQSLADNDSRLEAHKVDRHFMLEHEVWPAPPMPHHTPPPTLVSCSSQGANGSPALVLVSLHVFVLVESSPLPVSPRPGSLSRCPLLGLPHAQRSPGCRTVADGPKNARNNLGPWSRGCQNRHPCSQTTHYTPSWAPVAWRSRTWYLKLTRLLEPRGSMPACRARPSLHQLDTDTSSRRSTSHDADWHQGA